MTCHLGILRLMTLGVKRRRRTGLSRCTSRLIACCHSWTQAVGSSGGKAPRGAMDWRAMRRAATKLIRSGSCPLCWAASVIRVRMT